MAPLMDEGMTRDLREYARKTESWLLWGFLLVLFIVGDGLIYYFYGPWAALMGLFCLLGVAVPALIIWGLMALAERITDRQ